MKKRLLFLCSMFIIYAVNGQVGQNFDNPWGTWGVGSIANKNTLNIFIGYPIEGYHLYYDWSDLEPRKNDFKWKEFDEKLKIIADKDIWIGVQIMVGPNSPEWIYDNVPKVITSGHSPGPYPYYFDPDYKERYFNLLKEVADHLNNLPGPLKNHLMYWQVCEGSTGDEQPYKGDPVNPEYAIDYYDWQDYRHLCWEKAYDYAGQNRYFRFLFNSGNRSQDLQYVEANYPEDFTKSGWLSHEYSFDGELIYYARQIRRLQSTFYGYRTRGEIQGVYNYPWWRKAPVKQSFTLVCSALAGGLDMLNIGGDYINATKDSRPTDFFKKYGGLRKPAGAHRGFIALRDVPNFSDTARFPVKQYGNVIDPLKQKAFDSRMKQITTDERDSITVKYWETVQAIEKYLNPKRRDKIINEFKPAGAMYNDDGDDYHLDFGINMANNFARFIRQIDPHNTSIGAWRIGADSSIYGRYARLCKLDSRNRGEMHFAFYDSLVDGNKRSDVELSIVYFDTGNGKWSVKGSNKSFTVTNKNTKKWVQKVISFDNFQERRLLNGAADFSIRYESGTNTPFALIEVKIDEEETSVVNTEFNAADLNLKLSPNPNKGRFTVELTAPQDDVYSISITDIMGINISSENKPVTAGVNTWNFSSPNLKKGVYMLHIQSSRGTITQNFIIDK